MYEFCSRIPNLACVDSLPEEDGNPLNHGKLIMQKR